MWMLGLHHLPIVIGCCSTTIDAALEAIEVHMSTLGTFEVGLWPSTVVEAFDWDPKVPGSNPVAT